MSETKPLEFDQIILVCTTCKAEYAHYPLRPITTPEIKPWLERNVLKFCGCPNQHCDVKLRIKCPECPHSSHKAPCKHCGCTQVTDMAADDDAAISKGAVPPDRTNQD